MQNLSWENSVELENGVVVSYWVLQSMQVDMLSAQASVTYHGYLSESALLAGKAKVLEKSVSIDFSSFDPAGSLAAGVVALVRAAE